MTDRTMRLAAAATVWVAVAACGGGSHAGDSGMGDAPGGAGGTTGGSGGTPTGGSGGSTPCPEAQPQDGADCRGSEGTVCEYEPNVRCSCPVVTDDVPVWSCEESEPDQCNADTDCRLWSDCCGCLILEPGEQADPCLENCITDRCAELGVSEQDVSCNVGHCGIVSTCNVEEVTCEALAPDCGADELPSVVNGCWGPCVHAMSFCVSSGT